MYFKKIFKVIAIALIIAVVNPQGVFASEWWSSWNQRTTDNPLKDWTVIMNQDIDSTTVNADNVYIVDYNGNKVLVDLSVAGRVIRVSPRSAYSEGNTYYICIQKNIKSKSGKGLANSIRMPFVYDKVPDEIVTFSDAGLEDLIREELGKPEGAIYKSELLSIESLSRG